MNRGTGYIGAAAIGIGMLVALLGLGEFDAATGLLDPAPFNVYLVVPAAWAAIGAPVLAFVAWLRGWRR